MTNRFKVLEDLVEESIQRIEELKSLNVRLAQDKKFLEEECRRHQEKFKDLSGAGLRREKLKSRLSRLVTKMEKLGCL